MLDEKTRARLRNEAVIWMTTVRPSGQPQTSVVWFLLEADEILIYSRAGTARTKNVAANPHIALNLDGNGRGGAVVTIEGRGHIESASPPASENPQYVSKYRESMQRNGWTPEVFSAKYPTAIRIQLDRVRAW